MYSSEKEMYETPAVQVVEVKAEGMICSSDTAGQGYGYPGGWN